jgi:hypothetical protein
MPCFSVRGWRAKEVPVSCLPLLIVLGRLIVLRPLAIDLFMLRSSTAFPFHLGVIAHTLLGRMVLV